ncbi:MAG: hypothetical protein K1X56_10145 [Flavobacteriales bacterium]|nr:hypothetical protein [Flavobacteriales bacterium]
MPKLRISILVLCFFLVSPFSADAQKAADEEVGLVYRKEAVGGLLLHTRGFGFHFRYGIQKTYLNKLSFGFDLVNMRSPKEIKVYNPTYDDGKGYFYGKMNGIIVFRPFIGSRRIVFQKLRDQGVEVGFNWGVGPSFSFAKPVYLQIIHLTQNDVIISDEKYDPVIHNTDNIYGRSNWGFGLSEMKTYIGGAVKFGLHFEFSPEEDLIRAFETGMVLDVYPQKVPIMANDQNKPYFLTLYLNFIFGRKYF